MIQYDIPISKKEEDLLNRKNFSERLALDLSSWQGSESLVVSVCGKWGSGKSSILNLVIEKMAEITFEKRPTVIMFNPWMFSNLQNLSEIFFDQLSKELFLKQETKHDKEISKRVEKLALVLSLIPKSKEITKIYPKFIIGLGLAGLSINQILNFLGFSSSVTNIFLFILIVSIILAELFEKRVKKVSEYLDKKEKNKNETVLKIKEKVKTELRKRGKKLLVIIDDIDRLTKEETKDLFRLLKANADFPNTIYLLAFDRSVVERTLNSENDLGRLYLEKIVQVSFDVPMAKDSQLSPILFKELDKVLERLPISWKEYFDQEYWATVYNAGYKNLFKDIRTIKRYANSLEFNLSLMYKDKSMEVNPIDFFAIEAIRIKAPEFYDFMRFRKNLFTEGKNNSPAFVTSEEKYRENRKNDLEQGFSLIKEEEIKEDVHQLILALFPQVKNIYDRYAFLGKEPWDKLLRVSSPKIYDAYFTLLPGGGEDEYSQYELDKILNGFSSVEITQKNFEEALSKKKLRNLLERIYSFINDKTRVPDEVLKNIALSLFDISDIKIEEQRGFFDFGVDVQMMQLVYKVFWRYENKKECLEDIKKIYEQTKGFLGPIEFASWETGRDQITNPRDFLFNRDEEKEVIRKLGLNKIKELVAQKDLLETDKFFYVLYRWKKWDIDNSLSEYMRGLLNNRDTLIKLIDITVDKEQAEKNKSYVDDYEDKLKYLKDFVDLSVLCVRLSEIKPTITEERMLNKINYILEITAEKQM